MPVCLTEQQQNMQQQAMALNSVTIVNVLLFYYTSTDFMIRLECIHRIKNCYRPKIIDTCTNFVHNFDLRAEHLDLRHRI